MAIHNKNYKATRGINEAAQAHQCMESLRKKVVSSISSEEEMHPPARKRWNEDENESIHKLFRKYIDKRTTPPLCICESYEKLFKRDKKQIQDKVMFNSPHYYIIFHH